MKHYFLSLLLLSCGDCPDSVYPTVANQTECSEDELRIEGCGDRVTIVCHGERRYCEIDWDRQKSKCWETP